jgi:RNA polymerase sigma-70 factor, ECF subfamily
MREPEPLVETQRDRSDLDTEDARCAAGGDMAAFERLYRRHSARVNSMARWLMGSGDTDDVVQEVFVRMWTRLDTFRGEAPFGTWLHRLAVNVMLRSREQTRRHEARYIVDDDAIAQVGVDEGVKSLYRDIETAVTSLPPRARDVFVLYDMIGYSHGEIAELLNISPNTSRWQLHEARAALRRYLD